MIRRQGRRKEKRTIFCMSQKTSGIYWDIVIIFFTSKVRMWRETRYHYVRVRCIRCISSLCACTNISIHLTKSYLSIYLSNIFTFLSIYLSIYLSIKYFYFPIYLSIYLSNIFTFLSIYLSIKYFLLSYLSISLTISLSI